MGRKTSKAIPSSSQSISTVLEPNKIEAPFGSTNKTKRINIKDLP